MASFLISYDSAIFARISIAENGSYQFQAPAAFQLPQQAVDVWMQESLNSDAFRWALYTCKGGAFRESMASSDEQVNSKRNLPETSIYPIAWHIPSAFPSPFEKNRSAY